MSLKIIQFYILILSRLLSSHSMKTRIIRICFNLTRFVIQFSPHSKEQMNMRGKSQPAQKRVSRRDHLVGEKVFLFSKRVVLDSCFLHWLALAPFLFYIAELQLTGGWLCAGET